MLLIELIYNLVNLKQKRARKRREYDEFVANELDWRASSLVVRKIAEERLMEAKQILRDTEQEAIDRAKEKHPTNAKQAQPMWAIHNQD